jgi:DNA processing protein
VELDQIERDAEMAVLAGEVMVSGIHSPAHQRAAIVPLRWGAPRILVFSGGFFHHLGPNLKDEPFRAARLWRYQFDPRTDLVISKRAPDKLPTFARFNPTVDRLIERIAMGRIPGALFGIRR